MTREYNVIDADGHVLEPPDLWEQYIEPRYRDRCPKLVIDGDGNESFFVDETFDFGLRRRGKEPATLGLLGSIGSRDGEVDTRVPYLEGRKGGFDPHARIVDMDREGIDAAFLYPSLGLFLGGMKDPDVAAAACRAYNRWLADYCKPYPDRLFGAAMLPMQSSVAQLIDEVRLRGASWVFARASCGRIRTTTACCMTANTIRSGKKRRNSTSPLASTAAPKADRTRSRWIASSAAAPCATRSRIRSR